MADLPPCGREKGRVALDDHVPTGTIAIRLKG